MGRWLPKTKINELPQLLNILLGDMRIVGPRPQTRRCFNAFPAVSQVAVIRVRPGLSGIGSIFFRDEEGLMHGSADPEHFYDSVIMQYKGRLEQWYVANRRLRTYLVCIAVTAWVVLVPASQAVWNVFAGLPACPVDLEKALGGSA